MAEEPMRIVDVEDGWKEARIGDRVLLRFQLPPNVTTLEVMAFAEHLLKLVRERQHGPS